MATGTDCVTGTYGDGIDEQVAGSISKKIDDIIDAHDATKCHVTLTAITAAGSTTPLALAVIYWAD